MKKLIPFSKNSIFKPLIVLLFCFLLSGNGVFSQNKSHPFEPGEKLNYSMHFGWFDVGNAEIWIDPELKYVDGEAHYSIQCTIHTSSWVKFFRNFTACYESLVNAKTLKPLVSKRDLKSGKDIDVRTDRFYYRDSVKVHAYVEDLDEDRYHSFVQKDEPILDFLSTYLYVRSMDLKENNDPVDIRTFYSNTLYEFQMIPDERKDYNLKKRKIKSREYKLQFPKNEMFKKGKHGSLIMSEGQNTIPLRMDINIILGSFFFKLEDK